LLVERRIRRVPVVDGGRLGGIVSRGGVVALLIVEWACQVCGQTERGPDAPPARCPTWNAPRENFVLQEPPPGTSPADPARWSPYVSGVSPPGGAAATRGTCGAGRSRTRCARRCPCGRAPRPCPWRRRERPGGRAGSVPGRRAYAPTWPFRCARRVPRVPAGRRWP